MTPLNLSNGRPDGRTNAQVIIDLVKDSPPHETWPYAVLQAALTDGGTRSYGLRDTQGVVRRAAPRLLREYQRALRTIVRVGYKTAHADEHCAMASTRRSRADTQARHGLALLREVRWDELDQNVRKLHEAQLMIAGAMFSQMAAFERRLRAVESAIRAKP